jgi:hypothetical protein
MRLGTGSSQTQAAGSQAKRAPPRLHVAEQHVVLAADVIALDRERRDRIRQGGAAHQAVAAAVVVVQDARLGRAFPREEAFQIVAVIDDVAGRAGLHRPEHRVGVVADLGGQQTRPASRPELPRHRRGRRSARPRRGPCRRCGRWRRRGAH